MQRLLLIAVVIFLIPELNQANDRIERFEKEIRPLLTTHCFSCHDGKKTKGGLDLSNRSLMLKGGDSGAAIIEKHPEKSLLIEAVKYEGDLKMPPKGKLKPNEIQALETWIKNGAAWPESTTEATKTETKIIKADRTFWAFLPLRPFDEKQSVDTWIEASLTKASLELSKPADKRTLLRRVTFDMIGLPPTIEEWEAFESDTSPKAFEKVVDRLLASPHYGERWARHWLDVARYADSNGMDENTAFQNAWRYRDYVVDALNRDKSFEQFVREQIAGDLMSHDSEKERLEHLTATGFLVLGPKLLAESDKQKMVMDIVDEQLDTTGKAFLGMTVGCARCHDHKFDPIPTKDYYALAGIFSSTKTMQSLATVAKVNERPLSGDHDLAKAREHLKKVEALDKISKKVRKATEGRPFIALGGGVAHYAVGEKLNKASTELRRAQPPIPMTLAVSDELKPSDIKVHIRGNHLTLGELTPRGSLSVVSESVKTIVGSGRLQLADWIASPQNPLTARVIVNRIWQHHFGEGIVRSVDNFGQLGDRPSHPELLDWLANAFMNDRWSIKALHKRILLSKTYQQANGHNVDRDPENRLLSHFPRRRLDAEQIRDGMLMISNKLDRKIGGSIFESGNFEYVREHKYDSNRRSIYLPLIRNNIYDFLQTFDFPEPNVTNGKRSVTTVASQALFLMNNVFVQNQCNAIVMDTLKKIKDTPGRVDAIIRKVFLRRATESDHNLAIRLIEKYQARDLDEKRAWTAWVQVLFASNEWIFLE